MIPDIFFQDCLLIYSPVLWRTSGLVSVQALQPLLRVLCFAFSRFWMPCKYGFIMLSLRIVAASFTAFTSSQGSFLKPCPNFLKTSLFPFRDRWSPLVACFQICAFWSLVHSPTLSCTLQGYVFVRRSLYIYTVKFLFKCWDKIFHGKRYRCFYKRLLGMTYVRNSLKCVGCVGGKECKFQIIPSQQLLLKTPNWREDVSRSWEESYFHWRIVWVMEFSHLSGMIFLLSRLLPIERKRRKRGR